MPRDAQGQEIPMVEWWSHIISGVLEGIDVTRADGPTHAAIDAELQKFLDSLRDRATEA